MRRRDKVLFSSALVALAGIAMLFVAIGWFLWKESIASDEAYAGGLAASLGQPTEKIIIDTRNMLATLDRLPEPRCSDEHLQAMKDAAISRPHIRGIGSWRTTTRLCGVGFLPQDGLRPSRADRIYESGLVAWWPGAQTEVGGVQLFLVRLGDHDAAIDPRLLLDVGPRKEHQAVLWVENLRMAASPRDARLPEPGTLPVGVTVDRERGLLISRFHRNEVLPVDVVAAEPIDSFMSRHSTGMFAGAALGLLLMAGWLYLILRISRVRLSLAAELRRGLAEDRIRVRYQPVMDLVSRRCIGAEALARWERESGEPMGPDVFIPLAEKAGLIQDVTLAVLRIVVRDLQYMTAEFPGISANLNLSPGDLENDRTSDELARSLAAASLPAGALKLEITERGLINSEAARSRIRNFRSRGHQVAVDDFGTGYSSLAYLQSFELDVMKIDKTFVDAIGKEAATSQVIVHVIEMAKSLSLDMVAEGVETGQQVEWLVGHGVLHGQGFLFSAPLAIGDFLEFFRSNGRLAAA